MKLNSIIFCLGLFSLLSGLLGFLIWIYFPFLFLILVGILLNVLSAIMERYDL